MHKIESFSISSEVFGAAPMFRRVVLLADATRDPDVDRIESELEAAHTLAGTLIDSAGGVDKIVAVQQWRSAFRSAGIDPSIHRPAVEALLRRVSRGHHVGPWNPFVDAGTAVSLRFQVAVGVHVLDGLTGHLRLRGAVGTEAFMTLDGLPELPKPGEIVWAVDNNVLTRCWVWRQGGIGSVTEHSKQFAVNVDLLDGHDPGAVDAMRQLLEHAGATVREILELDCSRPSATPGTVQSEEKGTWIDPVLQQLHDRGLVAACTDPEGLGRRMSAGSIVLYCGIDPTASSLHVGSLLPLVTLRRFQVAGHQPIVVIGGATATIGDPSGKRTERPVLDSVALERNGDGLRAQVAHLLPATPGCPATIVVDNMSWTNDVTILDFLQEVGRHARVGDMLSRDSVRLRRDSDDGISFAEFTYSLLQAFDFEVLARTKGCCLQVGGSDQWGNIVAGIDLIRRRSGIEVYGLTWPLLLRSDGKKFGKSDDDNVWLDSERTTPWKFWQFWMNVSDDDASDLLLMFSCRSIADLTDLLVQHRMTPGHRLAQRTLADELTAWVHSPSVLPLIHLVAAALFSDGDLDLSDPDIVSLLRHELPTTVADEERLADMDVSALLVATGLVKSRSEAARLILGGGLHTTTGPVLDPVASSTSLIVGRACLLRRGRRTHHLVVRG